MESNKKCYSLFSGVSMSEVKWLWYPFIPRGKITILQGDPGDGKSTMMMDIIAKLTTGRTLPDGSSYYPMKVIYQCSEDGLADTIKPRLEKAKADCNRIGYINEEQFGLTLDDEKIRVTIEQLNAKLLVIDPFQAYIGDSDMSSAAGMRKILRRLSMWAIANDCAVVLIGHLNKRSGSKELYRGLGSIDLVAAARSVIQIERDEEYPEIRILKHVKSSLAPKGITTRFTIDKNGCVVWLNEDNYYEYIQAEKQDNHVVDIMPDRRKYKQEKAATVIRQLLGNGPIEASVAEEVLVNSDISQRTVKTVKKVIGVVSKKIENKWYWYLPSQVEKTDE